MFTPPPPVNSLPLNYVHEPHKVIQLGVCCPPFPLLKEVTSIVDHRFV